ncbi:MAG TPA: serine/threonine-protein kinase [Kofleriaceae bacterium]|nr:serine/threonine-protein kinase [Kofleriaceae bacterium]
MASFDDPEPVTLDDRPDAGRDVSTVREVGRYELGAVIGRGGMGEIREAVDRQIGRQVAVKTIRSAEPSDQVIARFLREARIQGRLEHPAIPAVHELGRDRRGLPFFVMKKLSGTTLTKLLRKHPPPRQSLLRAFADVCLAVEFAHVHNIIHRDLKPDNIVLGEFGEVYVLDWGVAKVIGEHDSFDDLDGSAHDTRTGVVLGTPGFMAPEQSRGEPDIDARADVYSLGIVLRTILELDTEPPPELSALADRATAESRDERLPSARALAEGVQRYLDGDRDLALRQQLANEHLARARDAFARGDDARSLAMREAGRALALDPQLDEAGDLVGRLMLEPPAITPPEVEHELRADALQRMRANARGALWAFVAFLAFLPGLARGDHGIALVAAAAIAFGVTLVAARRQRSLSPWWIALALAPIIVLVARIFTPTLIAPGLAALIAGALAANPLLGSRRASLGLWALMSASVLGPLVGERLGWLERTMEPVPNIGLLLYAPVITDSVETASIRGGAFVLVLVGAAVVIAHVMRRTDDQLRRRLHLQAWHLRQLVPA